jgi:hypothetical protein
MKRSLLTASLEPLSAPVATGCRTHFLKAIHPRSVNKPALR